MVIVIYANRADIQPHDLEIYGLKGEEIKVVFVPTRADVDAEALPVELRKDFLAHSIDVRKAVYEG